MLRSLVVALALVAVAAQLPPKSDVLTVMKRVMDYALTNNIDSHGKSSKEKVTNCGWTHGAMMQGTMAAYRATSDQKYLDYTLWWGEAQNWVTCNYPKVLTEHAAANDMSCGQTYAEVYLNSIESGKGTNDTYIAHIRDKVLKVVVDRPQIDDWWWDDAYFMAMGAFARIGSITKDPKFFDKCFALYNDSATRRGLWSDEDHLYFRDETYKNKTTPHGKHVFWGRGEGWTSGALARTMEYLPKTHASYAVYASHLQMMAKTLKRVQVSA
jgi:rhamnogalacturonyl hydrolase YesR